METTEEVLEHCLQELYAAETESAKILSRLAKETEKQAERIAEACKLLGIKPKAKPAVSLKG